MAAVQDAPINSNGNIKEEDSSQLEQKIVKQLEYYFGDRNYAKDKFLRQKAEEDDGWVTFECLLTFSRLKALTTSEQVLVDSIKQSKSNLLEVSEDDKKLRRLQSIPLPDNTLEARQVSKAKTVYCKGFPKETTTLDEIEDFCNNYGNIVHIMMRRVFQTKEFKGSVFVEFSNQDEAKKFIAEENTKFKDEELIKMSKEDYYKKKDQERTQEKDKDRKRAAGDRLEDTAKKQKGGEPKEEEELSFPPGSVLHFKGVGEQTSREDLKELFGEHEEITWVDFARGETEGYVRFAKEGAAQRAIDAIKAANDDKICIRDVESEVHVIVEGEEETKYIEKVKEGKALQRQKKADKRGSSRRGRGGWGSRGRGRGRGGYARGKRTYEDATVKSEEKGSSEHIRFDDNEPASKQVKTEK